MKKRLVLLLMVFALVLTFVPTAMADHCTTCRYGNCRPATVPAYYFCEDLGATCSLSGWGCGGPHPFTDEEPLGAEFEVASVERFDDRLSAPAEETRVASLETSAPAQR
ncbi:MAG TPA: hypothetical protein VHK90_06495 [Thermoanaerobaculia bacterium]|nr:hypothetical protein [Thermoanaerobaculia bacterium]